MFVAPLDFDNLNSGYAIEGGRSTQAIVISGDNVIVINAEKVKLTGNKLTDKKYISHSGYPGGQKIRTIEDVLNQKPIQVVEHAVKGMLPKNRLGRKMIKKLRVYAGSEHEQEAQTPIVHEIKL